MFQLGSCVRGYCRSLWITKCPYCRLVIATELEDHLGSYKPWLCNVCGKWYKHKESLRRHTRDECGKMPRHEYDLDEKLLMNLRLDEKHTCPDCLDSFKNLPALNFHRSEVCGLDLKYECVKCHRRFKHKHNLRDHKTV
ncbi:replication initiator 1-like [Daktulosphaira vitifoliae]|uniref:replication initiator 1-like n=1 Tax=Daktulosphaira vitifoliae TaxID=58002 RepID=UPI0021A9B246|nr:replication initiator 1-like [Daktulosphaira vitifoliae]